MMRVWMQPLRSSAARTAPMRPSIMSEGATMSAPAIAWTCACCASTATVLYTGSGGLVAHECIVDLRAISKETGVTVDDVAKRLIDYGFHAPTVSFPVA